MNCKNCGNLMFEEQNFCSECGAKVIRKRLTFKNLFEHIGETFFNYDNKLLRTFVGLLNAPEDVIGSYIAGVRKKHVNPISYFGLAITIAGLYILVVNKFFPESMDYSIFNAPGQEKFQKKSMNVVQEYMSLFMMLYVPIYALIARITFIGINRYNYTELIVVFIYIQAQLSIISGILGIILASLGISQGIFSLVSLPAMILYAAYCLKRLYQLNFKSIFLRTLLFLVILVVLYIVVVILFIAYMLLTGDLQQLIEAQKVAQ